jgi:hypothetical protein
MAPGTAHQSLPSAGAAWLHMDRPTNLMVTNSAMLFDLGAIMRQTEQEFAALARLKPVKRTGPARPAQGTRGAGS